MDTHDYDAFVWGRLDPKVKALGPVGVREWAVKKIVSEVGEFADLDVKEMHGLDIDQKDRWLEAGDIGFAFHILCLSMGMSTDRILQLNIDKLTDRGDYATYLAGKEAQVEQVQRHGHFDAVQKHVVHHDEPPYTDGHEHPDRPELCPWRKGR